MSDRTINESTYRELVAVLDDLINWMPRVEPPKGMEPQVDASIERACAALATLQGLSPAQATPLTGEDIEAMAHRMAWRYKKSSDPHHSDTYTFNRDTLLSFAFALFATPPLAPTGEAGVTTDLPDMAKIEQDAVGNAMMLCLPKITQAYRYNYAHGKTEKDFDNLAGKAMGEAVRYAVKLTAREVRDPVWPYVATPPAAAGAAIQGWQPIETAPKDRQILLTNGQSVAQGWWEHQEPYVREKRDLEGNYIDQDEHDGFDGWLDCEGGMQPEPTHWMPLPDAPTAPSGD